ncbi:hypothetical protein NKH47_17670 [Mesorhizobium sp. M1060]|uniref:hypothetical protein n=1 Tax=unclassified Mesorhizobium TaxID=325217 RepID=UPI0004CF94BB|nr:MULTISPECIES: hypothetical protein [unclassified Mesorhizobium]WJI59272.1 hypothetical protein NLY33_11420 [Mesorhizobium sp. C432A]
MSAFFRRRVEATIEHMLGLLDEMDGDPDLEPEPVEEQHDREAASFTYVLADRARRRRVVH